MLRTAQVLLTCSRDEMTRGQKFLKDLYGSAGPKWFNITHFFFHTDISTAQSCSLCVLNDWFLFYGLGSRELVIRRNKSALFDLSVNSNKIHFTAVGTLTHTLMHMHLSGHSWPLDSGYKDTEREPFSLPKSSFSL